MHNFSLLNAKIIIFTRKLCSGIPPYNNNTPFSNRRSAIFQGQFHILCSFISIFNRKSTNLHVIEADRGLDLRHRPQNIWLRV